MATATFNTNIETPSSDYGKARTYNLDTVITKYDFGDFISFTYELASKIEGVSITKGNVLSISGNAYGEISVNVIAGGSSGTSGTSGSAGTSGTRGSAGTSGTKDLLGTSGSSGTPGTSGSSGTSGVNNSSGEKIIQATASTKLYGFYATMLEIINNDQTMFVIQNAIADTKTDWPTLVGANKKAGGGADVANPGVEVNPGIRRKIL